MVYAGGSKNSPWFVTSKKVGEMECSEAERNVPHFLGCHKPWGIFSILPHKPWGIIILPRFAVKQTPDLRSLESILTSMLDSCELETLQKDEIEFGFKLPKRLIVVLEFLAMLNKYS